MMTYRKYIRTQKRTKKFKAVKKFLKLKKFKKLRRISLFSSLVIVAAVLMGTMTVIMAASTVVVEAENMTWSPSTNKIVVSDSSASAGQAVKLTANTTGTATTQTSTLQGIKLRVKGVSCSGAPNARLIVDGTVVANQLVTSTSWIEYTYSLNAAAGSHTLQVSFTNQYKRNWNCARALYVDNATFLLAPSPSPSPPPSGSGFVTRTSNGQLALNGQQFRYSGSNMYWLGLSESSPDPYCTTSCSAIHYPPHSEIDTAMSDAQSMGSNVVRSFGVLSVGCPQCIEPQLGVFNDGTGGRANSFDSIDYAVSVAKAKNIRLVLTLVDNYAYYTGGKYTYLNWRGINADSVGSQFYSNQTVLGDFEQHIAAVLNHVNPYTGLAYKNDPTILAWETGNEMSVWPNTWTYSAWTDAVSRYIKLTLGAKQLVMDGRYGIYSIDLTVDTASLSLPYVDIETSHSYADYQARVPSGVAKQASVSHSYGKAFALGEYTWTGKDDSGTTLSWTLDDMLLNNEQNGIDGDTFWSLFANGVNHGDGFTLHWPGDTADMTTRAQKLRTHAYVMCPSGAVCRS
jgi:hypothetical protein